MLTKTVTEEGKLGLGKLVNEYTLLVSGMIASIDTGTTEPIMKAISDLKARIAVEPSLAETVKVMFMDGAGYIKTVSNVIRNNDPKDPLKSKDYAITILGDCLHNTVQQYELYLTGKLPVNEEVGFVNFDLDVAIVDKEELIEKMTGKPINEAIDDFAEGIRASKERIAKLSEEAKEEAKAANEKLKEEFEEVPRREIPATEDGSMGLLKKVGISLLAVAGIAAIGVSVYKAVRSEKEGDILILDQEDLGTASWS